MINDILYRYCNISLIVYRKGSSNRIHRQYNLMHRHLGITTIM